MRIRSQTQRVLLLSFIGSLVACGLVGIYVLILGRFGSLEGRVLGSVATIGAAAILALACAINWETRRWHPIGLVGFGVVGIALVLVLTTIWWEWRVPYPEWLGKTTAAAAVLAVAAPHTGLLALARLPRSHEWVRIVTVLAIGLLAILIIGLIIAEPRSDDWFRVLGVLAIIDVCGTIAVPILHRVHALQRKEQVVTHEHVLALTCPRCRKTQELPEGRSKCGQCGLRFVIEIEEERCLKCGYLLYRLESEVCPECGTPIGSA
jgi:hypothetical protein